MADVRRIQHEGAFEVALGHRQRLAGQGVHQVEVEVVEARVLRELHRRLGFAAVVDAAQALERFIVEGLDAETQPVHAGSAVELEAAVLGGARVGFQRDLAARREAETAARRLQEAVDEFRGNRLGVPPPKNTEWIVRPHTSGRS